MLLELALAAALTVSSPDDQLLDLTVRRWEFVLFHQEINDRSVSRLETLLQGQDIVDVQSPGGDFRASVRMARLLRERYGRVRVTAECSSGCAIAWTTARERMVDGFAAVTFHGSPLSAVKWMRANPTLVRPEEFAEAQAAEAEMLELLDEAGVAPWLYLCADRLQNRRYETTGGLSVEPERRVTVQEDYEVVWFPRAVLEAAGVRNLDRYDRPNVRQMAAIETQFGTRAVPRSIYWAQDEDCDVERLGANA
ncbi:hypothetical protein EON82_06105 [bacterium]|nr:MAG: hypothetical protein EON82_06105 [bacterium]